jgi:proteasome-associated ATPase
VLERLERSTGRHLFLEETPSVTFADIGGLDPQVAEIRQDLGLRLDHPDLVAKYGLRPARAMLLVGPPGVGKTLIAKAVANWLASVAPSGRARFMNVKPSALGSVWYSQSEANVREVFRIAREAGSQTPDVPVVMFFDEIDSVAATRGQSHMRVDDRVLNAFLAELDGLESRGNVIVVAATNRRDVLDAAAVREGRLGDLVIQIPRPGRDAAAAIFEKHLDPRAPYGSTSGGSVGEEARRELIRAVVSRVYAPNGMGALARIRFVDGTERSVTGRDLMSGALIENIARLAARRAALREHETGQEGISETDLLEAVENELEKSVEALTAANCHRFLDDVPAESRIAEIASVARRVPHEYRYLTVA